jgi:ribosomal protein L7/L12
LRSYPPVQKIAVIKVLRELTGCGLKEAKDLSEAPKPVRLLSGLTAEQAERARARFGAQAEVEAVRRGEAPAPAPDALPAGESFRLVLRSYPPERKIFVIRALRELTGLGLMEAKDLSEAPLPLTLSLRLTPQRADEARQMFRDVADVELRPA